MLTVVGFYRNCLLKEPLQVSLLRILHMIILRTALSNKKYFGRVQGMGKHYTWSNTWSSTSQPKDFATKVKAKFDKMQVLCANYVCAKVQVYTAVNK